MSIAPVRLPAGCHSLGSSSPCCSAHTTCIVRAPGGRKHRGSYDGRPSLGRTNPGLKAWRGGALQTDTDLRGVPDGPRFTPVSTSSVLPVRHRGCRAGPWVPCVTSIGYARQGKEGGSDPLGARGTIRATSRSRRTRISRVQNTGELANRFRPQSLPDCRAPTARPYLTPYHNAWVRDFTYGDMRGKGSGPHAWKATRLPNGFGFTDSVQTSPPVSGRAPPRAWRKDASAPRGGAGPLLQHPPAPTPRRVNAPRIAKDRVRWHRQAIHSVLAPAASQDG